VSSARAASNFLRLPWLGMKNESNLPQPSPRIPGQPRMFAIVYLGGGSYGLDVIEPPSGPRRLRRSTSLARIRKHLGKFQAPGDIVLVSEVLRALEVLSAPMLVLRKIEAAIGPEIFRNLHTAERIPDPTAMTDGAGSGSKWSIQIICSSPQPGHRIKGLLDSTESGDGGREHGDDPRLN